MKKLLIATILAAASLAQAQTTVSAELQCYPKDDIFTAMARYKERPLVVATSSAGVVYSIFTNDATKSWTLVAFDAKHTVGCVVATGEGFAIQSKGNI